MRAFGARVRQVSEGLVIAQVLSALPGAILGVPLGVLLFMVAVHGATLRPSLLIWLAVTVVGTLVAMAVLTIAPALIGSRESVVDALRSEGA
jgi:putative ABC transport system permease protein